ncbi:MAG TPA: hypothetical protein VHF25_03315 [Nitriliruptorales bacterium]|nr:hypothetical protein [Nitriliruptorales bacterium]
MGFMRPEPVVSAIFDAAERATDAVEDLRRHGFDDQHLRSVELRPGRYLLEDELTPDTGYHLRVELVMGALIGGVIGAGLVWFALRPDVAPLALLVGVLFGILFGTLLAGVFAAVREVPMDDDEDRWLDVRPGEAEVLVEVQVPGPITVHTVRQILAGHGARGFLSAHPV